VPDGPGAQRLSGLSALVTVLLTSTSLRVGSNALAGAPPPGEPAPSRAIVCVSRQAQSSRYRPVAESRRESFSDGHFGGSASSPDRDQIPLD